MIDGVQGYWEESALKVKVATGKYKIDTMMELDKV